MVLLGPTNENEAILVYVDPLMKKNKMDSPQRALQAKFFLSYVYS